MLKRSAKKRNVTHKPAHYNRVDCHRWESKIEIIRLISGKPDLKPKTLSEPPS